MDKPKNNKNYTNNNTGKSAKRLLSYIGNGYKIKFCLVLIFIIISSLSGVIGSLFIEILIDDYITPLVISENPVFTSLLKAILIMALIYLIGVIANLFYNRMMVSIAQGIQKNIRDEMFSHMQTLPIKYFDTHTHGDIMSRYTNDIDALRQMLSQSIPQIFATLISVISIFFAMLYLSLTLTIVVIAMVFIMMFLTAKIGGISAKYFIKQQESVGKINGYIEEMINGQKLVKVFCYENEAKEKFDFYNEELCHNTAKANKYANIFMPIMYNLGNLQYIIISILGGSMAINGIGGITLGVIASFLQLSRSFTMPLGQISMQLNSVVMALAGAERIFQLMDEPKDEDNGFVILVNAKYDENNNLIESTNPTGILAWKYPQSDGNITYIELKGDIKFNNVVFGYNEKKVILQDISLYAKPGEKIAFVGATGAGKTTITNLINRFYDLTEGEILYDGINIDKIKKSDLRRSLGVVLQETSLFTGTIKENILYGNLDATDEEVYAAAKLANADGFINLLSDGYDTILKNGGAQLSQGQRQLLSIARVAVATPPVMILDEATSSIDTRTEIIVQNGMDSLMKGRTVFVIAHRLSTIKNSNIIMVMDNGKIVEKGNHHSLITKGNIYNKLYTSAFEL